MRCTLLAHYTARRPLPAAHQPDSHITLCANLTKDDPNAHVLDQYMNPSNPLAHYDGTAEEILSQTDENVDVIVMSAGTGGTVSTSLNCSRSVSGQLLTKSDGFITCKYGYQNDFSSNKD